MTSAAIKVPSTEVSEAAHEALRVLQKLPRKSNARVIHLSPKGKKEPISVTVPQGAFELFMEVLAQMANGNAVTIVPIHAELTTQQAAAMLNVSRPHLVELIDAGKIPHRMVGTHRRVLAAQVLAYRKRMRDEAEAAMNELADESQKLGLGY